MFLLKMIDDLGVVRVTGSEGAGQSEVVTAAQPSLLLPH